MIPEAREVHLSKKDRKVLEACCRSPVTMQRDLKRAQIVLLAAAGRSTRSIAKEVGVQPRIVSLWRHRYADHGLEGLQDKPRPTVASSSAAFGRWALGIGRPPRDRRGRTGIVKGRSVRSAGNVLATLSCSASGVFAICCDLTRPTITRLARTFQSTRTRRRREQYMPLVAFCLRHFSADFIICTCEFDFRQAQGASHVKPRLAANC